MAFKYAGDDRRAGLWEFTGVQLMETAQALLFEIKGAKAWLPKAKVIVEEWPDGTKTVCMPEWLAKAKGLL